MTRHRPGDRVIGSAGLAFGCHAEVRCLPEDTELFTSEAFRFLLDLATAGEIKPVIDRTYALERIAEAQAYVDTGRKKGRSSSRSK